MTRLGRSLGWGLEELTVRGRQEIHKFLDRRSRQSRPAAPRAVDGRLAAVDAERFFPGVADPSIAALFSRSFPETRLEILHLAEALHGKRFDLLGYGGLSFGDPVDWHLDPVSGRRSALAHWSRLDPLDSERCGDVKVVWELNRQQWLLHLAQAYRLSGDERHAQAALHLMGSWIGSNPPGLGINWASSLEVALRLISWCWTLRLLQDARALDVETRRSIVEWVALHAAHVQRYSSYYSSPNTHLTGEALGLFYAGLLLPEVKGAAQWRSLGTRILVEQVERQILDDGVHFEQSTCYQRYTADLYLHFLILARIHGVAVPESVPARVQQLLDFLLAIRTPDGTLPQIGDADGGSLLPLIPRRAGDVRGTLAVAAAWFGRADYAWAAGGAAPEILWLLGQPGLAAFQALEPAPPPRAPSRLFPAGGYVVMQDTWGADANQLVFDVGPLGCPISAGHGHADLLSIQCSAFGSPFLVDPGVYCYAVDTRWRNAFRGTGVHSTVMVDGEDQAVPEGPFSWRDRPRAILRRWISEPAFDYADAEHEGYRRLARPVHHRRRVLFVKPRYWIVVDDLEGAGTHRLELRFQFGPLELSRLQRPWVRALGATGAGLVTGCFAATALEPEVRLAGEDPIEGWTAPQYGVRQPAPLLVYALLAALPARLTTVLLPVSAADREHPPLAQVRQSGASMEFEFEHGRDTVLIGGETLRLCTPELTRELR